MPAWATCVVRLGSSVFGRQDLQICPCPVVVVTCLCSCDPSLAAQLIVLAAGLRRSVPRSFPNLTKKVFRSVLAVVPWARVRDSTEGLLRKVAVWAEVLVLLGICVAAPGELGAVACC